MLKAKLQAPIVNQRIISREQLLRKFQRVLEWLGKCDLPWAWLSNSGHTPFERKIR
ncbi:hypothetical protein [Desulfosporosinus meridiei]|uniref:hypothetical protein n=1 Tax=Desulfosporosinus meridiei TaxID=79209 RepID=UPI0002D91FFD|nr:hypothetical protein [Desulfosporosinus meridiei]